jgi:geranylgeranyl diphosphate synthase type I
VAVEDSIVKAIDRVGLERLRGAMMHLIDGGGKRLRAVLPSLVGEAAGGHSGGHYDLGAAIEIIHNFTLIHDDIMDDDDIRRGRPAVHIAYDMPTAINAGDAMHVLAFEMLSESEQIRDEDIREVVRIVSRMVRKVSEGQQLDMDFETREDEVSEQEYLHMIEGKTAAMFETCAKTGALLAGGDQETQEACRMWGLETGLCFQLMDDIIDLTADTATIGKPTGSDILGGKRTLVAIHALRQDPAALPTFHAIFGKGEEGTARLPEVLKELEAVGSIDYGRNQALKHHAAAHEHLAKLPASEARAVLEKLTDWQLERMA